MKVGATVISSIEFHGRISLVIFMAKCPLRCPFCHNWELIDGGEDKTLSEIFKLIDDDVDYIDAVAISGGEPLEQLEDLKEILIYCKSLSLDTKLDTSGIYPERLNEIIGLVDYIAIDVKAPFDRYQEIIGADISDKVKESIEIANNSNNTFVECRTTYVPSLITPKDIEKIAEEIDCDCYTIQQFRNKNVLDESLEDIESPNPNKLREIAISIKDKFKQVKIKTAEFGEEIIE